MELGLAETLPDDALRCRWASRGAEARPTLLLLRKAVADAVAGDDNAEVLLGRLAAAAPPIPADDDWLCNVT